jgi:glycosyltransferase involved in cell wall biosynthesis
MVRKVWTWATYQINKVVLRVNSGQLYDFSIVLPCLNEERTLAECISEAFEGGRKEGLLLEVIVADNGSTDRSKEIAVQYGAIVVDVPTKGYGAAIDAGVRAAQSEYIVIADSDMSYNLSEAPKFVAKLAEESADLVLGNRFAGGIEKGAMPFHHKYLGNPVLSLIGRILFRIPVRDFHCGIRAIRKSTYIKAGPVTTGMEFATEMVARFSNINATIVEIPTVLRKDKRDRKPHLRSFPDGWRHLKMMLLYSPHYFLLLPGLIIGILGMFLLADYAIFGEIDLGVAKGDVQASIFALVLYMVGLQLISASFISMAYAKSKGVFRFRSWQILESVVTSKNFFILGIFIVLAGGIGLLAIASTWISSDYPSINPIQGAQRTMPLVAVTVTGVQFILSSIQVRQLLSKFW